MCYFITQIVFIHLFGKDDAAQCIEQYAAEKLKVENADGEYTAIKM